MNYPSDMPAIGGGAYPNSLGQDARAQKLGPTLARGPSLEDRLEYLQRAVERICKIRSALEQIADRIILVPETSGANGAVSPTPADLTGRFGDTINAVHNQLDVIERLSERIYFGLFASSNQPQAGRG